MQLLVLKRRWRRRKVKIDNVFLSQKSCLTFYVIQQRKNTQKRSVDSLAVLLLSASLERWKLHLASCSWWNGKNIPKTMSILLPPNKPTSNVLKLSLNITSQLLRSSWNRFKFIVSLFVIIFITQIMKTFY